MFIIFNVIAYSIFGIAYLLFISHRRNTLIRSKVDLIMTVGLSVLWPLFLTFQVITTVLKLVDRFINYWNSLPFKNDNDEKQ